MTNLRRTNWVLLLLGSMLGTVACSSSGSPSGAAAKNDTGGTGSGGIGSGGASAKGGNAGSATGGGSGAGGIVTGGNAGTGGSAASGGTVGTGGRSGGAGGVGTGAGGNSAGATGSGGSTKAGSGGADAGTGVGGSAGGSGGSSTDAGSDATASERPSVDTPADRARDLGARNDLGADSACPTNQTLCGGSCVDTSTSSTNCGGCGSPCGADQVCSGGSCVGATANDGCTDTLASNLTLQQIAVYQTVKIPVMDSGNEVAAASRDASVVQGRTTLFRVFVTPGTGWSARSLAARLTLVPSGGQPMVYSSKKTISAASTDADQNSTFQFNVSADMMVAPLNYSVEVVECTDQSGSAGQARFPASGTLDLGLKTTGVLKVKIIPMQVGTIVPDTSDTAMAPYAAEMMAMYPITAITFTVGDTMTVASPVDWSSTLDALRAKRSTDKPANDIYYFGLIKPADTLRAYCQSSCTTGIGYVVSSATGSMAGSSRAAMGIGFGDGPSTTTMAHEIGHNHGLSHAPCSTAGTISGVDANYPYANAVTGVWGYDSRTQSLYDPAKYKDIMSYCSPQWISDYNYQPIVTRVAAVNGAADVITMSAEVAKWRIILVDSDHGPRWGIPLDEAAPAEGDLEMGTIYDGNGEVLNKVPVYRTDISDISAKSYMVPEPNHGWYAISVGGAMPLPFAAPMPRL